MAERDAPLDGTWDQFLDFRLELGTADLHAASFRLDAMSRRAISLGAEHAEVCGARNSLRHSCSKRWEISSSLMRRASRQVSTRQPKRPRHSAVQVYLSAYGPRYEIYTLNLVTFR